MKITPIISPNSSNTNRPKEQIKFVIIHYTGMQSEIESIKKLKNPKSKVSCHYLINRKGEVIKMVEDRKTAWHAGKSKWKNYKNLNSKSIGIELVNKGHQYGYQSFSKKQIKNLIYICKKLKKKYSIKKENFLGYSDIAPLRKFDPGEKFPWEKLSNDNIGGWYNKSQKKIKFNLKKKEVQFFKNLKKIGYRYFDIFKRCNSDKKIIKSFQQHYLPNHITGKIDLKTLKISHLLANKF